MPFIAIILALLLGGDVLAANGVDLRQWALNLPDQFVVHGVKTEPTYEEAIDIRRQGGVFTVTGGAPSWAGRATESVMLAPDGSVLRRCPEPARCFIKTVPTGFLATALLVSAARQRRLYGRVIPLSFGARAVICVPAAMLGIPQPIFDPCFDLATGAVLAQRHRLSHRFDGPSLDASSVRVELKN
jgi:hypothetical protein